MLGSTWRLETGGDGASSGFTGDVWLRTLEERAMLSHVRGGGEKGPRTGNAMQSSPRSSRAGRQTDSGEAEEPRAEVDEGDGEGDDGCEWRGGVRANGTRVPSMMI